MVLHFFSVRSSYLVRFISAFVYMNALASFIGWLPFFVLAVIKVFLFGIIKTDPLVFAFLFISSFTDGFGILNRYFVGDIVAFFLLDFFVSSFVDFFPNDFASFILSLL